MLFELKTNADNLSFRCDTQDVRVHVERVIGSSTQPSDKAADQVRSAPSPDDVVS